MNIRLRGPWHDYEIRAWHEVRPDDAIKTFFDVPSALAFLSGFSQDPFAMNALRQLTTWHPHTVSPFRSEPQAVLKQVAWHLVTGRLYLVVRTRSGYGGYGGGSGTTVLPDPQPVDDPFAPDTPMVPPQVATYWITFQVLDDDTGVPVAGVDLRLRLPDGTLDEYTTDADGIVHVTDLPAGTCDLERMLDDEAFEVIHVA